MRTKTATTITTAITVTTKSSAMIYSMLAYGGVDMDLQTLQRCEGVVTEREEKDK